MQIHDLTQQTPTTNSQLIFDTGSATYKALVSDIAKCIIEQYAGSTIGGTAQTLAAAIEGTYNLVRTFNVLASGADLNTIVTAGHYAAANTVAGSLINCPVTRSFRLTVETGLTGSTNNWLRQILIRGETGDTYTRYTTDAGVTWTSWKKTNTDDANGPHLATGASSSGTLLATDTNINQLLTGEYYWASASYRPSVNIPDNTAVRGRLWALDSGGQDIYCAQICYTSNFNWYIRYCTSKSSYTWTEWKQISGTPKQLSGITSLSDIPIGSNGYAQFDASVSPTGATAYFTYWCTGVNDRRSLIAVYTADSTAKAYVNVLHNSDGVTWKGWKSITLS